MCVLRLCIALCCCKLWVFGVGGVRIPRRARRRRSHITPNARYAPRTLPHRTTPPHTTPHPAAGHLHVYAIDVSKYLENASANGGMMTAPETAAAAAGLMRRPSLQSTLSSTPSSSTSAGGSTVKAAQTFRTGSNASDVLSLNTTLLAHQVRGVPAVVVFH